MHFYKKTIDFPGFCPTKKWFDVFFKSQELFYNQSKIKLE